MADDAPDDATVPVDPGPPLIVVGPPLGLAAYIALVTAQQAAAAAEAAANG